MHLWKYSDIKGLKMMKKVLINIVLGVIVTFSSPALNGREMPNEITIKSDIPGQPPQVSGIIESGQEIELQDGIHNIDIKILFDVDGDNKTGIAEIIYLLQLMGGD